MVPKGFLIGFAAFAIGVGTVQFAMQRGSTQPGLQSVVINDSNVSHFATRDQEAAGLCPWRNQQADMQQFFPTADRAVEWNIVVSGQAQVVAKRLGRTPTGDEHALRAFVVIKGTKPMGYVITRRVRGEYGLIELLLIVEAGSDAVKYARIQRLREPGPIAQALQSEVWLKQFVGLTQDSDWGSVAHSPLLGTAAATSGTAVVEAARTAMILFSTGRRAAGPVLPH